MAVPPPEPVPAPVEAPPDHPIESEPLPEEDDDEEKAIGVSHDGRSANPTTKIFTVKNVFPKLRQIPISSLGLPKI